MKDPFTESLLRARGIKVRKKLKNPLLEKKYQEGRRDGIAIAVHKFFEQLEVIDGVKGIGPETRKKLRKHLFKNIPGVDLSE